MARKAKKTTTKQNPVADTLAPIQQTTAFLAATMNEIDTSDDITQAIKHRFKHDLVSHKEGVDQVIVARAELEGMAARYMEIAKFWTARGKRVEGWLASIDKRLLELVNTNKGVPFEGNLGKLAKRKNPPSLKTSFGGTGLTKEIIEMFGIDEEFYEVIPPPEVEETYKLKTQYVKNCITKEKRKIPWATTEAGEQLEVK